MLRLLCLLLCPMIWMPMVVVAQTYPAPLTDTVSDYADLLPDEAEARITAALQTARDETGAHIVLATLETQADYGGTGRFADFATGWFNAWGIGDATRNDGVLILVARQDHEMRIALGSAYGPVWDGRAQRVIDTAMLPAFRKDDYARGLEDGAMLAIEQLARPFAAHDAVSEDSGFPTESLLDRVLGPLVFVFIAIISAFAAFRQKIGDFATRFRRCPNCGAYKLSVSREVVTAPGEDEDGQAATHIRCSNCQNDRSEVYAIPSLAKQRAESSKSSSGFGGGRSGGGGASGRW
jgi:uncharacterized protein